MESGATCGNGVNIPDSSPSPSAALQSGAEGHLGNVHRPDKCRWTLTAGKGLRVRLTLLDFGTGLWQAPTSAWYGANDRSCRVYATVREVPASGAARGGRGFDVCAGHRRVVDDIYESRSHSIEVETFHAQNAEKKQVHFVLKFKGQSVKGQSVDDI